MIKTPETLVEHHLTVERTARFFSLGPWTGGEVDRVWLVCHGYSQLAEDFIKYFAPLDDGRTLVIAPEALSRFYTNRFHPDAEKGKRVGATWMTREDRINEIKDYTSYLDLLYDRILADRNRESLKFTVLGFSQGVATISRWLASTDRPVDRVINWAGMLPPDLDTNEYFRNLRNTDVTLVVGETDELVGPQGIDDEKRRFKEMELTLGLVTFKGGHSLQRKTLLEIAAQDFGDS